MADTDRINSDCGGGAEATNHGHNTHRSEASENLSLSPSSASSTGPMRQLEFNQAMNDFQNMFPGMDTEVIEAVLRANNGIVDATIDQLLTMSIDNGDDDLPDHILMSVQREVALEAGNHGVNKSPFSPLEDTAFEESPPPYTEAIKSSHVMSRSSESHCRHGQQRHSSHRLHPGSPTRSSPRHHPHKPRSPTPVDLEPDADFINSTTENKRMSTSWDISSSPSSLIFSDHTDISRLAQGRGDARHASAGQKKDLSGSTAAKVQRCGVKSSGKQVIPVGKDYPGTEETAGSTGKIHPQSRKVSWNTASVPVRSKSFGVSDSKSSWEGRHQPGNSRYKPSVRGSPVKLPPYRNWNPPLLGTLPDDFLRLTPCLLERIPLGGQKPDADHRRNLSSGSNRSQSGGEEACDVQKARRSRQSRMPQRSLSFAGASRHSFQRIASEDLSSEFIQRRIKENERRRRLASADLDPELAQYLEDERLALILQNSEFLRELRDDEDFMQTLEKDRQTSVVDSVPVPVPVETASQNVPSVSVAKPGYGNDHQSTLEAFPFSQQLPKADEVDAELLQKLRHMGKASKKQFAALARKFFSRKRKKSPRHLLRDTLAPSMTNLLDDEEEDEGEDIQETSPHDVASNSDSDHCGHHADGLQTRKDTEIK
ncbi:uncharacterized protein LOC112561031 isoform X2 [Pomacea canaliculata]|uniref:uncharacterized protein LOC112561031 isoform X2 n=1 Tax=Pomacea canaliculata TaxID=400727 RepID=UPI000D7309FB|nr:uncharacterized protein LOC112561031 isoform X2 [Pomacea canaliculata]